MIQSRSINILLVEDNPADTSLFRRVFWRLEQDTWNLVEVQTLQDAISTYNDYLSLSQGQQTFDVVLLDLGLPDATGLDTLKQFRAALPNAVVIVLTGLDDENLALQAVGEGAQDYLVKDQVTTQWLLRTIRFAIERQNLFNQLKYSEECARNSLEREQELNHLKSSFVAMVSHEFRNPLGTIRNGMEIIRQLLPETLLEANTEKWFNQIESATDQLVYLVNDVLLLSQMQATNLRCNPISVDLEDFCSEIIETISYSLDDRLHSIWFDKVGDSVTVFTDTNLLWHICTNLLSNAIKYSPQGGVIQFGLTYQRDHVILQVQDPGIGISEETQRHLFESFYRGNNAKGIAGTGLGLVIVKRCVDVLQGNIQITSQLNVGTTVTVTLPLTYQPTPASERSELNGVHEVS
ncbi:ATP-binding protein [Alkalinema pantanalense CENA528]|uniref:sensor histidine kinase n=1 Tax=Alkalinema pantanalense TaxID=1620705 RepID=UPI003D6E9DF1